VGASVRLDWCSPGAHPASRATAARQFTVERLRAVARVTASFPDARNNDRRDSR
jgi:hypothetical protein